MSAKIINAEPKGYLFDRIKTETAKHLKSEPYITDFDRILAALLDLDIEEVKNDAE